MDSNYQWIAIIGSLIAIVPGVIALLLQAKRERTQSALDRAKEKQTLGEHDASAASAARELYAPYVQEVRELRAKQVELERRINQLEGEIRLRDRYIYYAVMGGRRLTGQVLAAGLEPVFQLKTLEEFENECEGGE